MPERVTKEEKLVSLAIEKARKTKEMLSQKDRENVESTQVIPNEMKIEIEKVKRPKAQNVKVKNQTQKKEGYGLAGESLKKEYKLTDEDKKGYPYRFGYAIQIIKEIHNIIKDKSSIDDLTDKDFKDIKRLIDYQKNILDS